MISDTITFEQGQPVVLVRYRGAGSRTLKLTTVERISAKGWVRADGKTFRRDKRGRLKSDTGGWDGWSVEAWTPELQNDFDRQETLRVAVLEERKRLQEEQNSPYMLQRKRLICTIQQAIEFDDVPPSNQVLRQMVRCLPGHEDDE